MNTRQTEIDKGTALLTAFSPAQRSMVISAISARGPAIETDVMQLARASVLNVAPLDFVRCDVLSADEVLSLLVGLKAVVKDALQADWTIDQYSQAIEHAVKVPSDLALSMAKNVVTEDSDATAFGRALAGWIPNIPLLPFDDVARGAIKLATSLWVALLPKDYQSKALDAAYEWLLLGGTIRQLGKRQALTDAETQFELESTAIAKEGGGNTASMLQLVQFLQQASHAVGRLAESGDVDSVDHVHEYGHLANEGYELMSRAETGDVDAHEIGGFGSKIGGFLKKVASPLGAVAGSMVGMPGLGASIGGSLSSVGGKKKRGQGGADAVLKKAASAARDMGASAGSLTYSQVLALLREVSKL